MTHEEFINAIKGMSVIELMDLVKALEAEFGVSAAAPVAAAAAPGAAAAAHRRRVLFAEKLRITAQKTPLCGRKWHTRRYFCLYCIKATPHNSRLTA